MIFGIELIEIIFFLKQVGLAVAGAACLWGMILLARAKKAADSAEAESFRWVAQRLLLPFSGGLMIALMAWVASIYVFPFKVFAHEGVTIIATQEQILSAFRLTSPLYILLIIFAVFAFILCVVSQEKFYRYLQLVFASFFFPIFIFSIISIIVSLPAWTGVFDRSQMFFIGHSFHSIFTLGTVLVLDFTMLSIKNLPRIQRHIYPFLPNISKVIWAGLAIDFLSVWLVFDRAFALTPKFFFIQTVIGILIINGAFLSGPMTQKLILLVKKDYVEPLVGRWNKAAGISGVISITSWITITLFDFFKNITLNYSQLLLVYVIMLFIAYVGYQITERLTDKPLAGG